MTRDIVRGFAAILAASALTFGLAGCGSDTPAPDLADPVATQTETGPADQAIPSQTDALNALVAEVQSAIPGIMDQNPGLYSEVAIEAIAPDGVHYVYTYADPMDPAKATEYFDGLVPTLQTLCDTQVFPSMVASGVTPTQKATYTYLNADGSELWSHTFEPSSQ